jgi:bifunctional enzyme CysN/CysC
MMNQPPPRQKTTRPGGGNQANLVTTAPSLKPVERAAMNGHPGGVLWFTGLPAAGKSMLAMALQRRLFDQGHQVYVLDGDNLRQGLNRDLGFSAADRSENIRRVAELARLFADAGFIVIAAFISPYRADRQSAREIVGQGFHEIFIDADLATCERRDPKGHYARARAGEIAEFTGISAPYEAPLHADLTVPTATRSVDEAVAGLADYVAGHIGRRIARADPDDGERRGSTDQPTLAPLRVDRDRRLAGSAFG